MMSLHPLRVEAFLCLLLLLLCSNLIEPRVDVDKTQRIMSPSFQLSIISFQSTENELSFTRSSHVIEIIQHALFNFALSCL